MDSTNVSDAIPKQAEPAEVGEVSSFINAGIVEELEQATSEPTIAGNIIPKHLEPIDEVSVFVNSSTARVDQDATSDGQMNDSIREPSYRSHVPLPRLVLRNLPFSQSLNEVEVQHNHGLKIFVLLRHDWFHVFLRLNTVSSLLILLSVWTCTLLLFAGFYVGVDNMNPYQDCGLGKIGSPIKYGAAFAFSLETCTTVGYGLPGGTNAFFENCPTIQVVLYFQMLFSMFFNAFLIAFFYSRIARADNRGNQVVLSDKAIMTVNSNGQVCFQVRVYDVDAANPVIEARIRMYAVMKARPVPRPLRISDPNDELGGMLFLSFPSVVTHHVDIYSLLHPPRETPINPSGITLRQSDAVIGNRREFVCPICAESYGTYERYRCHVKFLRAIEAKEGYPIAGTHQSIDKATFEPVEPEKYTATKNLDELKDFFAREISEVICVVEGIEPSSSGTFAALQSYMFEDVVFQEGASFSPCVEPVEGRKGQDSFVRVDLDRFHTIETTDAASEPIF